MKRKAAYPLAFAAVVTALVAVSAPLRASENDDRIVSSFTQTYVYKTYLKDDAIKITASEGVVTLTGTVADDAHKTLAQETAASLPGVTRVDNQLASNADSADMLISSKVRLALLIHRSVNFDKTVVEVKDGLVTLKGEASSLAQKELTGEYAEDIDGVREVRNEMTVAAAPEQPERTAGEKLDDASITAQVRTAMFTHRSTSATKIAVDTRNGEVVLTGVAQNAAEKSLATKLVTDIRGVIRVKNEMTLEEAKTK